MRSMLYLCILVLIMQSFVTADEIAVTPEVIAEEWEMFGEGVKKSQNGILLLQEGRNSRGLVLLNPEIYGKKVVLSFEIMPLNPLSVFSVFLSVTDKDEEESLTVPYRYDGGMKFWKNKTRGYLFRFGNAVDNELPGFWKFPDMVELGRGEENGIIPGIFNKVEIGRKRDKFWLLLNGKEVMRVGDFHDYDAGCIGFRLSGAFGRKGECLLRNIRIVAD